jgi:hypothetical protein
VSAAGQSNFLLIQKSLLSFVAGISFLLLVHSLFVAVGLDNIRKTLPFSVAAGSYFICWLFKFYTAG